ncbi:MAG: cation-transporting P-type ATPase [Chlamydiae bacterium]|nr:cation-transporting P-type ATPase [Chlamydiota bacterium]
MSGKYHFQTIGEVLNSLDTSYEGLPSREAESRLKIFGKNKLKETKISKFKIFVRQLNNILIYVLLFASFISLVTNKILDFIIIITLVIVNTLISFFQELKAEASLKALQKLTESKTKTIRDKKVVEIPTTMLVPGDIVILSEGDLIGADLRLFESSSLMIDESSLTGESIPVIKDHLQETKIDALIFEMKNYLFSGTTIVKGYGKAIVTNTGRNTYFAKIAEEIQERSAISPLTKALNYFTSRYIAGVVSLFIIIGIYGFYQGRAWLDLAYILLAQLVSAVPEGLPMVVTLVLVIGALKLSKQNTLVRYLPAVETLGSASVIASDKTGTITQGNLVVEDCFSLDNEKVKLIGALCNDYYENKKDPIDASLVKWIENFDELRKKYPRIISFPFDVSTRVMACVNEVEGKKILFVKGAFESLKEMAVNKEDIDLFEERLKLMSENGLRILAFGLGDFTEDKNWKIQLIGLVGFLDPPKKEVKEAVLAAQKAKIKVIMLTGDHPLTARAIAKQVSIYKEGDLILTGKEIDKMQDLALLRHLHKTSVLARILPEHKSRVVKILQESGEIVAVSGDGVNDAPALKRADLGIAMGSGTEAAKSVAKMIITDSNLKVIVDAIRNGRVIAANIRKVIYYSISTTILEISLLSLAIFSNLPLPLSALQILWVNLITGGMQDKSFPFAKEEGHLMHQRPKKPIKQFFDLHQIFNIFFYGILTAIAGYLFFKFFLSQYAYQVAMTITFTNVIFMQLANGIQAQKEHEPFFKNFKNSFLINPYVYIGVAAGIVLQVFAVHIAPRWFDLTEIDVSLWKYPVICFVIAFLIVEVRKWGSLIFLKEKTV